MRKVNETLHARIDALMDGGEKRLTFERYQGSAADWQRELRAALIELLAVDYEAKAAPVEVINSRDMGDYTRYYIRMATPDGVVVPAYKLVPNELNAPAKAILCLHGHGAGKVIPAGFECDVLGREVQIAGERDYAVQAARNGYIAISPDMRGFGELMLQDDMNADRGSSCQQLSQRLLMIGRTILGMRVHDSMYWYDYLAGLDEVDAEHIYVTGQSGGGTGTLFTAACDPRFSKAAPSCYFCTFRDSILAMSHCTCNYAPGLLSLCEMYDIAGLIAPRPMLVIAGREDMIFPIDGVRRAFEKAQAVYAALGAEDNLELYVGDEGHRFYAARVWEFLEEKG